MRIINKRRERLYSRGTRKIYHLVMPDNGLKKAGIHQGDELWATPREYYRDGEIVAVRVGNQTYVRRLFNAEKYLFLEAEIPGPLRLSIERNAPGVHLLGSITRVLPATA